LFILATYSIRDLEKLSGIKAHTIRIWEQRYHLIEPKRTNTNIRYYTDDDLKYLLNIAFLNKNGVRISKIAKMTRDDVSQKVASISKESTENTQLLQSLTMSMVELNGAKFNEIFNAHVDQNGIEETLTHLVIPFLEKLSLLWLTGAVSTVHEQFIHALIRQKIWASLDRLPAQALLSPTFLLYLPKGEDQEISLLIIHYFLRLRGFHSIYLGMGLGLEDLQVAHQIHHPHFILTSFNDNRQKTSIKDYCKNVFDLFPESQLLLIGTQLLHEHLPNHHNLTAFEYFDDVLEFLDELQQTIEPQL
jgi:DNA-binding transcriptional MerR regulator